MGDPDCTRSIEVEGHDLHSLLFNYLDEILSQFTVDQFVVSRCVIEGSVTTNNDKIKKDIASTSKERRQDQEQGKEENSNDLSTVKAVLHGEIFDLRKHPQGTEIKAITYSAMKIEQVENRSDLYVIVDL